MSKKKEVLDMRDTLPVSKFVEIAGLKVMTDKQLTVWRRKHLRYSKLTLNIDFVSDTEELNVYREACKHNMAFSELLAYAFEEFFKKQKPQK